MTEAITFNIRCVHTYNTDAFQGKDSSAKKDRQLSPTRKIWNITDGGQITEDIVEGNTHASSNQYVRYHREWREVLKISHKRENNE